MAQAKKTGRDGIDTWTNNGYGLFSGNAKPAAKPAVKAKENKKKGKK